MKIHHGGISRPEAERLATLMSAAFTERERGWSAAELRELARQAGVVVAADRDGFGVLRVAAGEAEILTLAVAPAAQGRGLGARLVGALLEAAWQAGAERVALEVAETNAAAVHLYRRAGFEPAGRRRSYFLRSDGEREDAVILLRARP